MESLKQVLGKLPLPPSASIDPGACWCGGKFWGLRQGKFGTEYCPCPVGQKRLQEDAERERKRLCDVAQRRWDTHLKLPVRFMHCRLGSSPLNKTMPSLTKRLTSRPFPDGGDYPCTCPVLATGVIETNPDCPYEVATTEWVSTFEGGWYFWGGYGMGKTGLVAAMAHELIFGYKNTHNDSGEPLFIRFVTVPDLLTELRATYNDKGQGTESEVLGSYRKPDILILDDIGAEHIKGSGWVEDRLYQVIGHRHGDQKATWFTSNLSIKQLGERIGERIAWRIVEMCGPDNIVEIKGPNIRDAKP